MTPETHEITDFIERIPKTDLHAHSTGFIPLEMVFESQLQTGQKDFSLFGTRVNSPDALRQLQREKVHDLNSYLEFYRIFKRPFLDLGNFNEIYRRGLQHYQEQNAVIVEVRASINALDDPSENGIVVDYSAEQELETLISALEKAKKETGIAVALTLCVRRGMDSRDLQTAKQLLNLARRYRHTHKQFGVAALDLVGKEMGNTAIQFQEVFNQAIDSGLGVTIHAGEAVFQASIGEALRKCGADRIGHGVAARKGKTAYELIKDRRILLEICPTSNLLTGAVKCVDHRARKGDKEAYRPIESYADHPVGDFVRDGLRVSICTDGQSTVGTSITREMEAIALAHNWDKATITSTVKNGILASFCRDDERDAAYAKLQSFCEAEGVKL